MAIWKIRHAIRETYHWLRRKYLNSPPYATMEGWDAFEKDAKARYPIRYHLIEAVHELTWPFDLIEDVMWWIRHRTTRVYHKINTGLPPGYYDSDTRLLHGAFNLLVDFVEVECAGMHRTFHDEGDKVEEKDRSRANGEAYLTWMINLVDPDFDNSRNAEAARETLALYHWWVDERPKRPDPWATGRHDYKDSFRIQEQQENEDTEQLVRLCRVRTSMWT